MVNYGIVYGLSAYGLADRLQIPQEEAQEFIDRYLERFPAVAQFMKDAVEQAERARLRVDAVRPPPPDPRAARAQLADAQARRAARGQHGHPGHRGGHHQGRDGALPRRAREAGPADPHDPADPRRAAVRGARPRRPRRPSRSPRARWSARPSSTRRWRSTRASGRTGSTRSSPPARPGAGSYAGRQRPRPQPRRPRSPGAHVQVVAECPVEEAPAVERAQPHVRAPAARSAAPDAGRSQHPSNGAAWPAEKAW